MTKEKPILFSGPMVKALLEGRKTQTRRIMKSKWFELSYEIGHLRYTEYDPLKYHPKDAESIGRHKAGSGPFDPKNAESQRHAASFCPYGEIGTMLWVKETFMHEEATYCEEASVSIPAIPANTIYRADIPNSEAGEGWCPSIFMPRKLSRITLEITDIHVERLKDISEEDAIAEGIISHTFEGSVPGDYWKNYQFKTSNPKRGVVLSDVEHRILAYWKSPINSYKSLWESINGEGSWDANPWIWAISFRRIS